jgi:iron complex transport system substrate-binding protein
MEILAKDLYPQQFRDLDPTADYHHIVTHFTGLPDAPVILSTP